MPMTNSDLLQADAVLGFAVIGFNQLLLGVALFPYQKTIIFAVSSGLAVSRSCESL